MTLHYLLNCSPMEALTSLKVLNKLHTENEILSEAIFNESKELQELQFSWMKKGNKFHQWWDNTIMGTIFIEGNILKVEVNSKKRSEKIRRQIRKLLGEKALYRNSVLRSSEKMMAEMKKKGGKGEQRALMEMPEVQAKIREMVESHWKSRIDQKLPPLGQLTPSEAAKDKVGREKLEALLLDFDAEVPQEKDQKLFQRDVTQLRRILGLRP